MTDDKINYDVLMQKAHRGLIQEVLLDVEQNGLPGEHHFFIIFDTTHPGTRISDRLRAQYPHEMTIVMQHQYSNLAVLDEHFEIQLSFSRIPELLVIPYEAITGFVDPSVPFGLQLTKGPADSLENSIGMLVPGLAAMDSRVKESNPLEAQNMALTENELMADSLWSNESDSLPISDKQPSVLFNVDKNASTDKPFNPFADSETARLVTDNADEEEDENELSGEVPGANIVRLDAFRKKS